MSDETEDTRTEAASSPNARRGERRSPPIIDGTAHEAKDLSPNADPTAKDSFVAAETSDPPLAEGEGSGARSSLGATNGAADLEHGAPDALARASTRRNGAISILALAIAFVAVAAVAGLGWRLLHARRTADQALRSQVAALQARVDAFSNEKMAVAALDQRVSSLETTAKAAASAAQAARADAGKALAQVSAARAAAAKSPAPDLATLARRVAALEQRPDPRALQTEIAAQSASVDRKVGNLDGQLAAVTARLTPLEALLKAPKVDAPALEASNAKAVSQAQASALIVVARSLQTAVESGAPFAAEAAAAQKLGADPALLQNLQATAATGTPTAPALRKSFKPLAGPILAGLDRKHATGLLGRLASGLGGLVSVRTIGSSSGDGPVALVGRIEGALARGDVAGALAARNRLPASDQALTQSWAAQAQAHIAASQAARALLQEAIDQLGKAPT